MIDQDDSLLERVNKLLPSLAATAANLNETSKELSEVIERLDGALQRLNLGVSAWVKVRGESNEAQGGTNFWSEELGYSRIGRKWGLVLRRTEGDYIDIESADCNTWPFNEGPRSLRIQAITKIPSLLRVLNRQADKMVDQVSESINKTVPLVEAIEKSVHPQRSIKKTPKERS